jgi:hypothetical protein
MMLIASLWKMTAFKEGVLTPIVILTQALTVLLLNSSLAMAVPPKPFKPDPRLQTVVHIESSPKFLAKQNAKKLSAKTYSKNEQLSPRELKQILYAVGFRGERLREAWGTAMKESTGRPRAHNNNRNTGDNSYGLFQINMIDSLGPARLDKYNLESNEDLFNPVTNAKIAFQMSNGGKNWSAWHGITEKTAEWMKKFPTK